MQGRRVLEKHKHYALYHPSAFYLATVVADIPLAVIQVLVFEICVYFMMGLQLEAGRVSTSKIHRDNDEMAHLNDFLHSFSHSCLF